MKGLIKNRLKENLQQAEKVYFKTGKLSERAKNIILRITNGDSYTKIISDFYAALLKQSNDTGDWAVSVIGGEDNTENNERNDLLGNEELKNLKLSYDEIKTYNKLVFPIKKYNLNHYESILNYISALKQRNLIINAFKELPSIAIRNLKKDIRLERDYPELQRYRSDLEYFLGQYSQLNNRDESLRSGINRKLFKSDTTLSELIDFCETKENLLGGAKFTKNKVKELINNYHGELEIIYSQNNILIVDVTGPNGIKDIGCNSLWCFTYGKGFDNAYRQWNNYSTNDHVYVIINFALESDSPDFMFVLIKPLDDKYEEDDENFILYNMANDGIYNPNAYVNKIIGLDKAKKLMNFDIEPEIKGGESEVKKDEKYVNPNQLSLAFETKRLIKTLLKDLDK